MAGRSSERPAPGWGARLVFLALGLAVAIAGSELFSRWFEPRGYFVWPPGLARTFDAGEVIRHGVEFPTQLRINAQGMRGDVPEASQTYRILAVGGSTTICVYLDDRDAWPYRLQEILNAALPRDAVWVGNVGRPGHKTNHHRLQVEKLLSQHPEISAVVLLVGINDFVPSLAALTYEGANLVATPEQELAMAFSVFPGWDAQMPWYRRNVVGRAIARLRWRPIPGTNDLQPMDSKGRFYARLRDARAASTARLDALPDMAASRATYAENLRELVATARSHGARVLLLTQPTLYRDDLAPEDEALLWGGGPPFFALREDAPYYTAGALARGMDLFNETTLEICDSEDVECIDLAARMPKTAEAFFDDAHFTVAGSNRIAELVADYLLVTDPLRSLARERP